MGALQGRKLPIIHFTFAGDRYHSNVNDNTNFSAALLCELGHVFGDVCRRILYLCQRHGAVSRSIVGRIDTKCAFHQIPVDPLHAAKVGNAFGEYAIVDVFLQFGWLSLTSYWDLVASLLEHAHS